LREKISGRNGASQNRSLGIDVDIRPSDGGPLATGSCRRTGEPRAKLGFGPISGLGSMEARGFGGTSLEAGGSEKVTTLAGPLASPLASPQLVLSGDILSGDVSATVVSLSLIVLAHLDGRRNGFFLPLARFLPPDLEKIKHLKNIF
jgi:hypothetical protein